MQMLLNKRASHLRHFSMAAISLIMVLAKYSLWTKSSWPPVLVNKVLSEHRHTHSYTYFLWMISLNNGRG